MLSLLAVRGPDQGRAFPLPANEPQLVGRSTEAIEIHDQTVSRRHAELTPDGDGWRVRDLGSRHGTFVNGVRIVGAVAIAAGDRLRCGESEFLVVRDGERPPAALDAGGAAHADEVAVAEPGESSGPEGDTSLERLVASLLDHATEPTDADTFLAEAARSLADHLGAEVQALRAEDASLESFAAPGADSVEARSAPLELVRHAIERRELLAGGGDGSCLAVPFGSVGGVRGAFVLRGASPGTLRGQAIRAAVRVAQVASLAIAARDRRQARDSRERLALIGETVAALSHSIKNMLQGMRFGADAVELALGRGDLRRAQEGWPVLQRNLDRIRALALNMLAWAKERPLEPESVRVEELLAEVRELLEPSAGRRRVSIVVDRTDDLPPVELDLPSIHQALTNLAMNAIDAAPERTGLVTLAARYDPDRDELALVVRDNGGGVPTAVAARLFEPFLSTKGQRGTGLGLAVARKIAERHGGRLELTRSGPEGSEFVLSIAASGAAGDPDETRTPRGVRPELYGGRFE